MSPAAVGARGPHRRGRSSVSSSPRCFSSGADSLIAAALAGMAASFAGWRKFGRGGRALSDARRGGAGRERGRVSTARSAMLEMRLDHDSGAMTGAVLAGTFAGARLETLARLECLALCDETPARRPGGVASARDVSRPPVYRLA